MTLEELREKKRRLNSNCDITCENVEILARESYRVGDVAHNAEVTLDELDREFEKQTGLNKLDFGFLFFATALQLCRIVLINKLTETEKAGTGKIEKELKKTQKKIFNRFDNGEILSAGQYYAPLNQIITTTGVPYDATEYLGENLGILKGANHRFATVGHDPLLGLIFGTGNILTNTITCVDQSLFGFGRKGFEFRSIPIGIPLITTNHVIYNENFVKGDLLFKKPRIGEYGSTITMLSESCSRVKDDVQSVVAAVIKQIIHIGTDLFTPCGIQLPGANLVFSNTLVETMTKYVSTGDIIKVGASAGIASLINLIIGTLHGLTYDETKYSSRDVYSVKTRKILMWSNTIATGSNVIWVGANIAAGDKSQIKNLDIGGLIVTVHRLIHDPKYIRKIKEEFVFGSFDKMIRGDSLRLKELSSLESNMA